MEHFRLLDLAAELRNRIYEFALVQNRFEGQRANVALLRVSKAVYQEAVGIFWSQATICIKTHSPKRSNSGLWRPADFDFTFGYFRWIAEQSRTDTFVRLFPSAILKVAQIEIQASSTSPELPNHLLYSLASTLHGSSLPKQDLIVNVEHDRDCELRLAYPLLRMPRHLNIFYHSSDKTSEEEVRARYLENNKVRKLRPACTVFDAALEMEQLRHRIEANLNPWNLKLDTQDVKFVVIRGERKLISKYLKKNDMMLYHLPRQTASLYVDRLRMAYTSTLARWVEMREAGVRVGNREVVQLKELFVTLSQKNEDVEK